MDADEQWRPVRGFRGYEVSDQGRVRSYLTSLGVRAPLRRTPHVLTRLEHDEQGHAVVELSTHFGRVRRRIEVLIVEAFDEAKAHSKKP